MWRRTSVKHHFSLFLFIFLSIYLSNSPCRACLNTIPDDDCCCCCCIVGELVGVLIDVVVCVLDVVGIYSSLAGLSISISMSMSMAKDSYRVVVVTR